MEEIVKGLLSFNWWFSVVIVGIIVNIASPYIWRTIESLGSALSKRFRESIESRRSKKEAWINLLSANPLLLQMEYSRSIVSFLMYIGMIVMPIFINITIQILQNPMPESATGLRKFAEIIILLSNPILSLFSIFFLFDAQSRFRRCSAAQRRYLESLFESSNT